MLAMLWLQAPVTPAWVGPTIAVSLAVIALTCVVLGLTTVLLMRATQAKAAELGKALQAMREDLAPSLRALNRVSGQAEELAILAKHEAAGLLRSSRRARRRLDAGVDRLTERMVDLDALYEVVYDEVEDTAMGVAVALRTARKGGRILRRLTGKRSRR